MLANIPPAQHTCTKTFKYWHFLQYFEHQSPQHTIEGARSDGNCRNDNTNSSHPAYCPQHDTQARLTWKGERGGAMEGNRANAVV